MAKKGILLIVSILVVFLPLLVATVGTVMLLPYGEIAQQIMTMFLSLFIIMTAIMAVVSFLIFGKKLR